MDNAMALRGIAPAACLAVLIGMSLQAAGMGLDLNIREDIRGHAAWLSLSNGPVQMFTIRWENIGSANCLARARIDFCRAEGNETTGERLHTSWSSQEAIMSGQSQTWELYSSLPEGRYAAIPRVYHCNEIFEEEPYFFDVTGSEPEGAIHIEGIGLHSDSLDVLLRSPEGAGEVAVVPEGYPSGWIFESGYAGDIAPGESVRVSLGFVPVRLNGTAVKLVAVAMDGSVRGERVFSVSVPDEKPAPEWGTVMMLMFSLAVLLVVILYVSKIIIKIWRRQ